MTDEPISGGPWSDTTPRPSGAGPSAYARTLNAAKAFVQNSNNPDVGGMVPNLGGFTLPDPSGLLPTIPTFASVWAYIQAQMLSLIVLFAGLALIGFGLYQLTRAV